MNIDAVVDQINLVDYVGKYVELEERNGEYWGLSPLTNEKTPSFSIDIEGKRFYDFSSGKGGGIIKFIMLHHKVDGETAIRMAAQYVGIDLDAPQHRRFESTKLLKRLSKMKSSESKNDKTFLVSDVMNRYPFDVDGLKPWLDEGIGIESLRKFEVRYDAVAQSILFPIKDEDGNILVIKARLLDKYKLEKGYPKYNCLSKWGANNTLYGLFENKQSILEKSEIIIFEGEKSVMKCDAWGTRNTVAALTSHLNDAQVRILIALRANVVIAFDKGVDISSDANIKKLKHFVSVSAIIDSKGLLDDNDAPVDKGREVFDTLYQSRIRLN